MILPKQQKPGKDEDGKWIRYKKPSKEIMLELRRVAEDKMERPVCGAWSSLRNTVCRAEPMDNGRCRHHGGLSPRGPASPHWQGKGYSRYMPDGLAKKYKAFLNDDKLIQLRNEAAILSARLAELLENIDTRSSHELHKQMLKKYREVEKAMFDGADGIMQRELLLLGELITSGADLSKTWEDIERVIDKRQRVVDSEAKRLQREKQTLTYEQAMNLVAMMVQIVTEVHKKHHVEQSITRQLATRLLLLTGESDGTRLTSHREEISEANIISVRP